MIYLLTGSVNSGKTTKMIEIFNEIRSGDGFVTQKIFKESENIGQKIVRLSTQESEMFSLKLDYISSLWDEEYRYGNYSFSGNGIEFAKEIVNDIILNELNPIFLDEIGPLELNCELGLYNILKELLLTKRDMYIAIREKCVVKLIEKFNLSEYVLINV